MKGTPCFLSDEKLRLILFGGKGGVGKTSLAAATALHLSEAYPGKRMLVVSVDPAHSLSDSFDFPLSSSARKIYERPNLFGQEIDAKQLFMEFRKEHGEALKKIISRGTYLEDEDITQFIQLHFPGLDEVMAILKIEEFLERGEYELVVIDTAPTGHTLRLLSLPDLLRNWAKFLDKLMEKHRYMSRIYVGRYREDEADALIKKIAQDIENVKRLLQDKGRSQFVPVAILEAMVLSETRKLVERLREQRIPVRDIMINRVVPQSSGCYFCCAKREGQSGQIERIEALFPGLSISSIPLFPFEVKGEARLKALARGMVEGIDFAEEQGRPEPLKALLPTPIRIAMPLPGIKILLFGGKGGVGKTSLCSAFALQLSALHPDKRILLFSTDPAHSIADCLEQKIGDRLTLIDGRNNLFATEMDPQERFRQFKTVYAEEITDIFKVISMGSGVDAPFDRDILANLLDLVPPGLDEIMALLDIINWMRADEYDFYLLDNAPTGHLLRFLELPELMEGWLRVFFNIILKYRGALKLPRTSELLVKMSKDIKQIRKEFSDPLRCEFIPITIATTMAFNETKRLIMDLSRLKIPFRRLLINMLAQDSDGCNFCSTMRDEQLRVVSKFKDEFSALGILAIPWFPHELRGLGALCGIFQFAEP